jgi:N-acetylglucosaminyldiphosphoundecaprenol N-acetyl-beta-D-mannosaminyltransferase
MPAERVSIFGVGVDCVDMAAMDHAADAAVRNNSQCSIFAINPEKVIAAERNRELRDCLNASEFLIPDGIGVVLAARSRGVRIRERVPGSELMPRLCALAAKRGYRVFLFGAREETNARAAQRLVERYPGLIVAGRSHGYVGDADMGDLVAQINLAAPQFLFVALGSPKQEQWVTRYRRELDVNVIQGVGGTFDVIAGSVRRAPDAWIALNLEWLYRLVSNPRRLLRQSALVRFAWRVLWGGSDTAGRAASDR